LEVADKLVLFSITTACVAVALGLLASSGQTVAPSADVMALHTAISSVAMRPGSKVIVNVYVPKTASITIRGPVLAVNGSSIPVGYVMAVDRAVEIVLSADERSIRYKVWLSDLDLPGGQTYALSVECVDMNNIAIEVLSYQ